MEKYYIVNRELGCGSFGKVYVVESNATGIQYVAKQIDLSKLDNKNRKAAEKEIQLLSKMKHPNIVGYKEAYSDEMNLSIIMELCELGDLHGYIQHVRQDNERITDSSIMDFFVQICFALNYIHQQRILHRDLKTKNIFLKRGNLIKLGDFGVAKLLENSFELAQTCIGSPLYISPEICENRPYDKKSDIWALGCVLFELTTLKYAFTGKNMKILITKIVSGDHAPLPANTNPKIRHVIKKLLNSDPQHRPTTSELLSWPFVAVVADRQPCKTRRIFKRSQSGKDLRDNVANNTRTNKPFPIAKSSLNLFSNDITEPETKYKTNATKSKPVKRSNSAEIVKSQLKGMTELGKNAKTGPANHRKLPRSDSLYYNLIEANHNKKPDQPFKQICDISDKLNQDADDPHVSLQNNEYKFSVIKNINHEQQMNFGKTSFSKNRFQAHTGEGKFSDDNNKESYENTRKKWDIDTTEKNELISLLSQVDLVDTFQSCSKMASAGICGKQPSIDEMLFDKTSDLSHLEVMKPEKIVPKEHQQNSPTFDLNSKMAEVSDLSHLEVMKPEQIVPKEHQKNAPTFDLNSKMAEVSDLSHLEVMKPEKIVPKVHRQNSPTLDLNSKMAEVSDLSHLEVMKPEKIVPKEHQQNSSTLYPNSKMAEVSDLSHLELMKPEKIVPKEHQQNASTLYPNSKMAEVSDATYCISSNRSSVYEELEQRRMYLEQSLGVDKFVTAYKWVESKCSTGQGFQNLQNAKCFEWDGEMESLQQVWELAYDDYCLMH